VNVTLSDYIDGELSVVVNHRIPPVVFNGDERYLVRGY
jgi:hypothetical protein